MDFHCIRCVLAALGAAAFVSGCYTVELSDTTPQKDRLVLRGGPGAHEGELVRIVRSERTHYTGERVSFGIMPGMTCLANDFGDTADCYLPAGAMCLVVGPFVNAFALATPTLCTLLVEPFTITNEGRGITYDIIALGFLGAYRWRQHPHDDVVVKDAEDVLADGGYRPDAAGIAVSKSPDGTKLWHDYPGFQALMRDVKRNGKVDVMFDSGKQVRRFRMSKLNPGCLAFEDRFVGK